jgi:hypothetical protein
MRRKKVAAVRQILNGDGGVGSLESEFGVHLTRSGRKSIRDSLNIAGVPRLIDDTPHPATPRRAVIDHMPKDFSSPGGDFVYRSKGKWTSNRKVETPKVRKLCGNVEGVQPCSCCCNGSECWVWAGVMVMVRLFTSCLFFNQLRVCILKLFVIFLQLKRIHKRVCNQPNKLHVRE